MACASVPSVLRPWPVSKTRARAASLAGTSSTRSPSARSRWVSGRPIPFAPSTRPGPLRPLAGDFQQLMVAARVSAEPARRAQDLPVVPGLDRHWQLVGVHPDDHPVPSPGLLAHTGFVG